jgi:hypothetical protein
MKIIYIVYLLFLASCSRKLDVTWGTSDTILTFGQNFYCWALYKNNSFGSIKLDRERSKIEFYIKSIRGEIQFPGVAIDGGGDAISLQPGNSLISHFAASTWRSLAGISDTQIVALVARSVSGDYIKDSIIVVRVVPPRNRELEKWFLKFDSLKSMSPWGSKVDNKRDDLCRISDSLKAISDPKNDDMSIIAIAARRELAMYCGKIPYVCHGNPNETTPYSHAYTSCIKKECQGGKELMQLMHVPCPELFRLRNDITHKILKNPKRIDSDKKEYVKLYGPLGPTYVINYQYEQIIPDKNVK